jgi:hypothetical protein
MEKVPFLCVNGFSFLKQYKYQRLHENKPTAHAGQPEVLEPSYDFGRMNNTIGFEDGRWIRIVNVGDGSVRNKLKTVVPSLKKIQLILS